MKPVQMTLFREGPKGAGLLRMVILCVHLFIDIFGGDKYNVVIFTCLLWIYGDISRCIFFVAYMLHVASCYNLIKIGLCISNRRGPMDGT